MTKSSRVEVLGIERRRRFSLAEKARIVEETQTPGSSVALVAQKYDIVPRLIYYWRSYLRKNALSKSQTEIAEVAIAKTSTFVQLEAVPSTRSETIRVRLGKEITIDFPANIDPARLALLIKALRC
jgi:transposase-like protein